MICISSRYDTSNTFSDILKRNLNLIVALDKTQGITEVSRMYPLGTMNVFHGNPLGMFRYFCLDQSGGHMDIATRKSVVSYSSFQFQKMSHQFCVVRCPLVWKAIVKHDLRPAHLDGAQLCHKITTMFIYEKYRRCTGWRRRYVEKDQWNKHRIQTASETDHGTKCVYVPPACRNPLSPITK